MSEGKPRHTALPAESHDTAPDTNAAENTAPSEADSRAHLRLVTPETHPKPEPPASQGTLVGILAALSALMGLVGYVAVQRPSPVPETVRELVQLRDTYLERGMDAYLEEKEMIRRRTRERLESSDVTTRNGARNVAAFLFPDLLSDGDFERELAIDTWLPLQRAMENAPLGDPTRRQAFEDFKNMLWVFENGNRARPELTRTTRAVVDLFDAVSATR